MDNPCRVTHTPCPETHPGIVLINQIAKSEFQVVSMVISQVVSMVGSQVISMVISQVVSTVGSQVISTVARQSGS